MDDDELAARRAQAEQARENVSETLDALAARADLPSRMKARVTGFAGERNVGSAADLLERVKGFAKQNPAAFAAVSAVAGYCFGRLRSR